MKRRGSWLGKNQCRGGKGGENAGGGGGGTVRPEIAVFGGGGGECWGSLGGLSGIFFNRRIEKKAEGRRILRPWDYNFSLSFSADSKRN